MFYFTNKYTEYESNYNQTLADQSTNILQLIASDKQYKQAHLQQKDLTKENMAQISSLCQIFYKNQ